MLKLTTSLKILFLASALSLSSTASADGLLSGLSNLAEPYRGQLLKVFHNLSGGSSKLAGVQKSLSEDDCLKKLKRDRRDKEQDKIHSVIYFLGGGYSDRNLYSPYEVVPGCIEGRDSRQYHIGLTLNEHMRPNSFDSDSIIAERRCLKYLNVEKVQVVELDSEGEQKVCRKVDLSLKDEQFSSLFCVGDNNAYVDYHQYPVTVLEEIPFRD